MKQLGSKVGGDGMRIVMRRIDMVAKFVGTEAPKPVKFRLPEEGITVVVDKVLEQQEEKLAGNRMLLYRCSSVVRGAEKIYELKYELATARWFLFKM